MFSLKVVYGWMDTVTKMRENTIYLCSAVYEHEKALVKDLHAADVRYHLDCWLGAIATTISSILVQVQQTAQMVEYCYNKYECWSGVSVSDMHACRSKFNRHDC